MPPECSCCEHEPAGAAPRPASRSPLETPFSWTRYAHHNRGFRGGDKDEMKMPGQMGTMNLRHYPHAEMEHAFGTGNETKFF